MTKETAMKILKELHGKSLFAERTALETLIPELKESEDEKIRKALVRFHKSTIDIDGIKGADILAWLEKQGDNNNQNWKPSKGQINALEHFVRSIGESGYTSPYDDNTNLLNSLINDLYKLEKQGEQKPTSNTRYKVSAGGSLIVVNGKPFDYEKATITQKDFASKQEPKKIEDEIEIPFGAKDSELQEATYYIPDGFHAEIDDDKVVIKKGEKSAAWSDDDKKQCDLLIRQLDSLKSSLALDFKNEIKWLKSLKNRVQSKQEWSDVDDAYKEFVISAVEYFYDEENPLQKDLVDWLKSLKDRIGG